MFMKPAIYVLVSLTAVAGCTSVFAQNPNDFIRLLGGVMQNAIIQAAQGEWRKLSESEIACVDQVLRQRGSNLETVIRQGITPSDGRMSPVRAACSSSSTQDTSSDTSFYYVANTTPPDAFLSLRVHPTSLGQRIITMPNGTALRVLQRKDDGWWRVKVVSSGQEGWALSRLGNRVFIACCTTAIAAAPSPQAGEVKQLLWDHNGSTVYLVAQGHSRKFFYKEPKQGMLSAGAGPDALIFSGEAIGEQYRGTAYLFNSRCGKLPYQVRGPILDNYRRVELRGQAPRVDSNCRVIGHVDDLLAFQLIEPPVTTSPDVAAPPSLTPGVAAPPSLTPDVAAPPSQPSVSPKEEAAAIIERIRSTRKMISERLTVLRNLESQHKVEEIAARLATANAEMPLPDLKSLQSEANSAIQIFEEADEFKRVSEIADQRATAIGATLERITSDAPIVQKIQAAIKSVKVAQKESGLRPLQDALKNLNDLYDNNRATLRSMEFDRP
jgi:hypothetical protein